jgi:murein DD-endopeptidase MepM/ murein hydrolase activator NlpD
MRIRAVGRGARQGSGVVWRAWPVVLGVVVGLLVGAGSGASGAGPVVPGSGPVAPGSGPVAPGSGPVAPGSGPVAPGAGLLSSGAGPLVPGARPVVPSSGPVVSSSGPHVPGAGGEAGGGSRTDAATDAQWEWPTGSSVVVNGWRPPASAYGAGHRGIDVPAPIGTTAVAVDTGTVVFAGMVAGRPVVTIDHGGGLLSTLDAVTPAIEVGAEVVRGEVIGSVAAGSVSAGHCAGSPCLHVGARLDGEYVDPLDYLGRPDWPVLLPLG